jgi:hypothetical protein
MHAEVSDHQNIVVCSSSLFTELDLPIHCSGQQQQYFIIRNVISQIMK